MNINWARWIKASVAKHFTTEMSPLYLHHEGTIPDHANRVDYAEFRMVGPNTRPVAGGLIRLDIAVNILLVSKMDEADAYKIDNMIGIALNAFKNAIPVYKLGDGPDDDQNYLGCLLLRTDDSAERIRVQQMGKVEVDISMLQATVEGHYRIELRS